MIFKLAFVCLVLMALGLAAVFALWYLTNWLWWSVKRAAVAVPSWARSLTVEPPPGPAFNDSRDVWPLPPEVGGSDAKPNCPEFFR